MHVNLGKIRFYLLQFFGKFFRWLDLYDYLWPARQTFRACRWLWEVVSPSEVYHVVSFSEYASSHLISIKPIKTNRIGYAANAVSIGRGNMQELKEIPLPDINLYCVNDVHIHHGSDFVVNREEHIAIDDYCATKNDENKGYEDKWVYWQGGSIAILRKEEIAQSIDSGIMLNGKFSYNYYHNMYENLIKLIVFDDCNQQIPSNVPFLVDEDIFNVPSFQRIFEILSEKFNRDTIAVKKDEIVRVHSLYCVSSVNNLVPVHWDYTKGHMEDYVFDRIYTQKLRSTLLSKRDISIKLPKRIFITRNNTTHRHFNEDELYALLQPYGFQKVAPEEYTFEQQMTLFHEAQWIISGSGAALTNLLFSSPLCVIVCLYRNSSYIPAVFSAPACFNGAKIFYFQSAKGESIMQAHTSFTIDVNDFRQFVNDYIAPAIL